MVHTARFERANQRRDLDNRTEYFLRLMDGVESSISIALTEEKRMDGDRVHTRQQKVHTEFANVWKRRNSMCLQTGRINIEVTFSSSVRSQSCECQRRDIVSLLGCQMLTALKFSSFLQSIIEDVRYGLSKESIYLLEITKKAA